MLRHVHFQILRQDGDEYGDFDFDSNDTSSSGKQKAGCRGVSMSDYS